VEPLTGSSKRKGDKAELEVQALLGTLLGVPVRRKLGAGRRDDIGDIEGVPNTVVQVVDWRDVAAAVSKKPDECERQRLEFERQIGEPAYAATFVRLRGGKFRVCLTPEQWFAYWRAAT
jgi:hypothetical protein